MTMSFEEFSAAIADQKKGKLSFGADSFLFPAITLVVTLALLNVLKMPGMSGSVNFWFVIGLLFLPAIYGTMDYFNHRQVLRAAYAVSLKAGLEQDDASETKSLVAHVK